MKTNGDRGRARRSEALSSLQRSRVCVRPAASCCTSSPVSLTTSCHHSPVLFIAISQNLVYRYIPFASNVDRKMSECLYDQNSASSFSQVNTCGAKCCVITYSINDKKPKCCASAVAAVSLQIRLRLCVWFTVQITTNMSDN